MNIGKKCTVHCPVMPSDLLMCRTKDGVAMMGSLKVYEAKKHCIEVQRIVHAEQVRVLRDRAHAAATGIQEEVDTIESLLQLGLTEFEASFEQFERSDASLARLRQKSFARPPDLSNEPDITAALVAQVKDRYYAARNERVLRLLKSAVNVDRFNNTFAEGGPITNRVKKELLHDVDYEFGLVELPDSPVGFSMIRYRTGPPKLAQNHLRKRLVPFESPGEGTGSVSVGMTNTCYNVKALFPKSSGSDHLVVESRQDAVVMPTPTKVIFCFLNLFYVFYLLSPALFSKEVLTKVCFWFSRRYCHWF